MHDDADRTPSLADRIARCRARIDAATLEDQKSGASSRTLLQAFTAQGSSSAEATQRVAAVRGYIQNVPAMLEQALAFADGPMAPPDDAARLRGALEAALEAFDDAPTIPDGQGLEGLLDNAFLAYRLLPAAPFWNGSPEQAVRMVLGPFLVRQLESRAAAIQARAAEPPAGHDAGAPDTPPPPPIEASATASSDAGTTQSDDDDAAEPPAGAHGECRSCVHVRYGGPIARPAFDVLLDVLQPSLRQSYAQTLRAERDAAGQFIDERQSLELSKQLEYTNRPTEPSVMYCGLRELEGRYLCCEVKNGEKPCDDFSGKVADDTTRSCATCAHHRRPPSSLLRGIEKIATRRPEGRQLREEIRQTLQAQAQTEYEECVQRCGFLQGKPGTLPHCDALSSSDPDAAGYVVGPLVNPADRCDRWTPGSSEEDRAVARHFDQLVAQAKTATARGVNPPILDPNHPGESGDYFRRLAANAEADVLEYGMKALEVDADFIDSICARYMSDVWFVTERTSRGDEATAGGDEATAGGGDEATSSGEGAPRPPEAIPPREQMRLVPFTVELHRLYQHPDHPDLTLSYRLFPAIATVQGNEYRLYEFPLGQWQRLLGSNRMPLSLALNVSLRPDQSAWVQAIWM